MSPKRSPLADELAQRIARDGPLPFWAFMEAALYHPEHGYYAQAGFTTGRQGDFATAPDTGPLFGATLARVVERLAATGGGRLVELGPGSGRLLLDILDHASEDALAAVEVVAVEPFARRREALGAAFEDVDVRLVDGLGALDGPANGTGTPRTLLIANEVLDAQPTEVVRRTQAGWHRLHVDHDGERFTEAWRPAPDALSALAERDARALPVGQRYELSPAMLALVADVSAVPGDTCALLFDYGGRFVDVWPDRPEGTLRGFRGHQHADPLQRPGETDITFDVDVDAVARAAERAGLDLAAAGEQARLLVHLGLVDVARELGRLMDLKQLVVPGAFGGRFQAVVLSKGGLAETLGLRVNLDDPELWRRAAVGLS